VQDGGIELPMLAVSPVAGSATSSSRFWIVGSWPLFLGSGLSKSSYRQGSATPIFPRATSARCTLWSPGPCGMCQNDLHSAQTLVRGCVRGDGRGAARDRRPVRVHPERAHRERALDTRNVGRLRTLRPRGDFKLHHGALFQRPEAGSLNGTEMNEDIRPLLTRDEAVAFVRIEPLDFTLFLQVRTPFHLCCGCASVRPRRYTKKAALPAASVPVQNGSTRPANAPTTLPQRALSA